MNIADKITLDQINNNLDVKGTYKGYMNTSTSYKYYLPSDVRVLCDKSKIRVTQESGTPTELTDGYKITTTGYVYISSIDNDTSELLFIIH